jgi:hypothetical protein
MYWTSDDVHVACIHANNHARANELSCAKYGELQEWTMYALEQTMQVRFRSSTSTYYILQPITLSHSCRKQTSIKIYFVFYVCVCCTWRKFRQEMYIYLVNNHFTNKCFIVVLYEYDFRLSRNILKHCNLVNVIIKAAYT